MKKEQPKYEVEFLGTWVRCKKAKVQRSGWLHFELGDTTNGLANPKRWRLVK
jgi:hypothetical protein